jgi:hypothetical protein
MRHFPSPGAGTSSIGFVGKEATCLSVKGVIVFFIDAIYKMLSKEQSAQESDTTMLNSNSIAKYINSLFNK